MHTQADKPISSRPVKQPILSIQRISKSTLPYFPSEKAWTRLLEFKLLILLSGIIIECVHFSVTHSTFTSKKAGGKRLLEFNNTCIYCLHARQWRSSTTPVFIVCMHGSEGIQRHLYLLSGSEGIQRHLYLPSGIEGVQQHLYLPSGSEGVQQYLYLPSACTAVKEFNNTCIYRLHAQQWRASMTSVFTVCIDPAELSLHLCHSDDVVVIFVMKAEVGWQVLLVFLRGGLLQELL